MPPQCFLKDSWTRKAAKFYSILCKILVNIKNYLNIPDKLVRCFEIVLIKKHCIKPSVADFTLSNLPSNLVAIIILKKVNDL